MSNRKEISWTRKPVIFLLTIHFLVFALLPFYLYSTPPSKGMLLSTFIMLYLTGLSITAGYHRYYSHRSYKTNSFVETILLFFGSMAAQSSALRWAFEHRIHHAHVDTDEDPYTISKGFWYAHCLWILESPDPVDPKVVSDLMKNKLVMLQHNYYPFFMIGSNALAVCFFGWLLNDYYGAFIMVGLTRMLMLHHFTWFINSLAHTWGEKPFSQELSAVDNYFLSMLTFGEGYHNYHHTFANDYRNGIHWFHFDPTKWLIWTLHKLGLAHSLKRMDTLTIKKRIVLEGKDLLLAQLKQECSSKKDELERVVQEMSQCVIAKIAQLNELKKQYLDKKQSHAGKETIRNLQNELKIVKKDLHAEWRRWVQLSKTILKNKQPVTSLPA